MHGTHSWQANSRICTRFFELKNASEGTSGRVIGHGLRVGNAKRGDGAGAAPSKETIMDFAFTDQQEAIRDAIAKICEGFPDAYWLKKDHEGGFPHDFHKALADAGWLGICVPEAYGGSGLGITEAAIMMRAIAESGAGMSGASAVHINVFGLNPVVVFGTETQRKRMLPPMVEGKEKTCFNAVEDARGGPERPLHRQWTKGLSTARIAQKILLLARTTPLENVRNPTHGLSLFYTDFDRTRIKVHEIDKMGRK